MPRAAHGKRVQCQGGAKNSCRRHARRRSGDDRKDRHDSAFGCAGQRCLAVSVAVTVGDVAKKFKEAIVDVAPASASATAWRGRPDGSGDHAESKSRILDSSTRAFRTAAKCCSTAARWPSDVGNFIAAHDADRHRGTNRSDHDRDLRAGAQSTQSNTLDEAIEILRAALRQRSRRSSRRAAQRRASSATRRRRATSASTSA